MHKSNRPLAAAIAKLALYARVDSLATLRFPAFRYLLLDNMFSQMGYEARLMGQAWLILELTNSDAWVGTVTGLPALVSAATALLGGVLADRLHRRRMLVGVQLAVAGIALLTALLVTFDRVQMWQLLVLAFMLALCNVTGITVRQTLIIDVVARPQLFSANALFSAAANLATVLGPALAGVLIARGGAVYAFYLSAILLIGSALAAAQVDVAPQHGNRTVSSIWHDFKEGIRYVLETPVLQWLLLIGLTVIAVGVWFALVPRYARDLLDAGATGYGAILAARGLGGLVGVITLIAAGNVRRLALVLVLCALSFAALVIAFALSSSLLMAALIAFALGIVFIWWPATLRTAFQFTATDRMRGRVMSLFSLVGQLLTLGWFVGGLLSALMGPQTAMVLTATLCGLVQLLAYWRSADLRKLGQERTASE